MFRMIRNVTWSGEPAFHTKPVEGGGRVGPMRVLVVGVLTALRQGRVQLYMTFMVLTLLVVFLVAAMESPDSSAPPAPPAIHRVNGVLK